MKSFLWGWNFFPQLDGTESVSIKLSYPLEVAREIFAEAKKENIQNQISYEKVRDKDGLEKICLLVYTTPDSPIYNVFKKINDLRKEDRKDDLEKALMG